jgi:hypothetical protein
MASPVIIANMALSKIGVREIISDLTEASTEARTCNLYYDHVRDFTLAQSPWQFATRRKLLDLIETDPNAEWTYRYGVPVDMVEPRYIEGAGRNIANEDRPPWTLEGNADTERLTLMADASAPILVYTTNAVSTNLYPPHFVQLMAWNLAVEIVLPLTMKEDLWKMSKSAALGALAEAKAHMLNQGGEDVPIDSEFVRARE